MSEENRHQIAPHPPLVQIAQPLRIPRPHPAPKTHNRRAKYPSHGSPLHQPLDRIHKRVLPSRQPNDRAHARPAGQISQILRLARIPPQRPFGEAVLARLDRGPTDVVVFVHAHAADDELDVRVVRQVRARGVRLDGSGQAEVPGGGGAGWETGVAERCDAVFGGLREVRHVRCCGPAAVGREADESDADCFHGFSGARKRSRGGYKDEYYYFFASFNYDGS